MRVNWDGTQTSPTLTARNAGGGQRMPDKENFNAVIDKEGGDKLETVVRRLTPTECERLQGFPDGWTDIGDWTDSKGKVRKTTDSARYKALGNSIATPWWHFLVKRISAHYEGNPTLGSLFDGISGFPLCWTRVNGVGSVLWESELEPFCIAVSTKHFGDEGLGIEGDIKEYL